MAWQLIYTSAPRLLEAGRSGFGTVARHRAIHPLLVTVIERDSQFDRSTGGVVFAHRILTAAGSRFHVLTCIRDAGADYTGRTNHIAHHLIIEPREIAALGSATPTPADVLEQMDWRPAWSESPRWLDGTDEIPLSRFHRQPGAASAWQTATGEARRAALLQPVRDACLILPPGADALALFADSLWRAPAQSWQATFTTSLQAGDESGDFRWLALAAASPLRANAENARAVLDLTAPHTLPIPAEPAPVAADAQTAPRSGGNLFLPVPTSLAATGSAKMGSLFDDKLAAAAPRPARRSRAALWLGLAALAAALIAGVLFVLPMFGESAAITKQREDIRAVWNGIFGAGPAAELADVPAEKLPIATLILNVAHDTASALRQPKLPPPLSSVEETRKQAQAAGINIPPPIQKTFEIHADFHARDQALTRIEKAAPDAAQLDDLAARHKELLDMGPQPLQQIVAGLKTARLAQIEALWSARFMAILELPPGNRPHEWFRKQLGNLPQNAQNADSARKAGELISDWGKIVTSNGNKETITALLKERRHLWPPWLVTLANESSGQPKQEIAATGEKPGQKEIPTAVPVGKPLVGELMILLPTDKAAWRDFASKLSAPGGELRWHKDGSAQGEKLLQVGKGYRVGVGDAVLLLGEKPVLGKKPDELRQGAAAIPPYELVILKDGSRLVTAWAPASEVPLRTVKSGLERDGYNFRITNPEAVEIAAFAVNNGWNTELKLPNAFAISPPAPLKLPVAAAANAEAKSFAEELNKRLALKPVEQERADDALKIALDARNNALADVNKHAAKPQDSEKKDGKKSDKAPPAKSTIRFLSDPRNLADLGEHMKSYGNSPEYENLFNAGRDLASLGKDKLTERLPQLIEATEKTLDRVSALKGGKNENERKQAEAARQEKLAPLRRLKLLLEKMRDEVSTGAAAETAAMKAREEKKRLGANPILKQDELPSGEYRLVIKPPPGNTEFTLILFKIP